MKYIIALIVALVVATSFSVPDAVASPLKTEQSIVVMHPEQPETFAVGKDLFNFKNIADKDNSKNISVVEITHAPRHKGPFLFQKHVMNASENFYALDGEFEFFDYQSDTPIKVNTGDIVYVPSGTPYGYKHVGAKPGKILVVTTSRGLQNLVEEIGTPVAEESSSPSASVPLDMEKVASVARKYGIQFFN